MSKTILVTGNAGSGKTTVSANLSLALANFGYDVLLVDGSLESPGLGFAFGCPLPQRSVQDVLARACTASEAVYQHPSGLKLLFASIGSKCVGNPAKLELPESELTIIDVPIRELDSYNAVHKTAQVLFVTTPDFPSVMNCCLILSKIQNPTSLVLNRCHFDNFELSQNNVSQLTGLPVLASIPEEPSQREALKLCHPLVEVHPDCKGSLALKGLAAKLVGKAYESPLPRPGILARLGLARL